MNSWPFCFNFPNSGTASIYLQVLILLCMKRVNSTFAQWQSIYRLKDTVRLSHIRCQYLLHSLRHHIKNWQYLCSACILHNKITISLAARSLLTVTKSWITRTLKLLDQTGTPFSKPSVLCASFCCLGLTAVVGSAQSWATLHYLNFLSTSCLHGTQKCCWISIFCSQKPQSFC